MSRQADEARERNYKKKHANGDGLTRKRPNIVTFHPTKEERQQIADGAMPVDEVVSVLAKVLERNCGLSVGYDLDRGNFFAIVRDKGSPWEDAIAGSAFHSDMYKSLQGLAFALSHRWPDFPENVQTEFPTTDDW